MTTSAPTTTNPLAEARATIDDALSATTRALDGLPATAPERRDLAAAQRHLRAATRALEPVPSLRSHWDWRP